MRAAVSACEFQVLGIPPHLWAEALSDSRMMGPNDWASKWVPPRPDTIEPNVWHHVVMRVYTDGPLAWWAAMSSN